MVSEFNGVRYRAAFRCGYCKTVVEFAGQAPDWQEDARLVEERSRAEAFVAAHAFERIASYELHPGAWTPEQRELMQELHELRAHVAVDYEGKIKPDLLSDTDLRVFPCPTCNAWIRPKDGIGA